MPPRRDRRHSQPHLLRGIRASTANNAPAYGFSLAATGTYGVLDKVHGTPSWYALFLFLVGGCAAFALVNAGSTVLFRRESPDEPELVIALATSLSLLSVCGSVGAASGISLAIESWAAWPVAALVATTVYVGLVGVEIWVSARLHPHGPAGRR